MSKNNQVFPFELKTEDVEENGIFKGYGSTFGGIADSYGDIIMPGAFTKTLKKGGRNGTGIAMLLQHDSRSPIGIWNSLIEDKKGLEVEGQLAMKTQAGQETYELMKIGALKGLSIGYDPIDFEIDSKKKVRYLSEVSLWEISPVTFGANLNATITTVKGLKELIQQAKTERELERALRDSDIFSKANAQHVISLLKTALRDSGEANTVVRDGSLLTILDGLKQINQSLIQQKVVADVADAEDKGLSGILNSLKQINV